MCLCNKRCQRPCIYIAWWRESSKDSIISLLSRLVSPPLLHKDQGKTSNNYNSNVRCLSNMLLREELRDSTELCPDLSCLTTNRVELVVAWREERVFSLSGTVRHVTVQTLHSWRELLGETCYLCLTLWWCMLLYSIVLARTLYKHRTSGAVGLW